MIRISLALILICFVGLRWCAKSPEELFLQITLYDDFNRGGPYISLDVKGCLNIPDDWNDRASSIALRGKCIKLFKDRDCTGRMIAVSSDNGPWLSNLKKLNFNDAVTSVSSCRTESIQLESGRYVFQSPLNRGVLTVRRLVGGYTMLKTEKWRKDYTQQWDFEKNEDNTFWLTPRMFENNRVTYDLKPNEKTSTLRMNWVIEGVEGKIYRLKKAQTNLCLTLLKRPEIELRECQDDKLDQHWIIHRMRNTSEED